MPRMSTTPLTIISACKGRLPYLRNSLPTWLALPHSRIVLVDYDDPDKAGEYASALAPTRTTIVRTGPRPDYNPAAAKNLGARAALKLSPPPGWLLFLDAEVMVDPAFPSILATADPAYYYHAAERRPGLLGSFLLHSSAFPLTEGFDETYRSWGWEDADFYEQLLLAGLRDATFPAHLLTHQPHDDLSRTRYYADKNLTRSTRLNMAYCCAKLQLMKISGTRLSPERKAHLYEMLAALVDHSAAANKPAELPFELASHTADGWTFSAKLSFNLTPATQPQPKTNPL